MSGALDYYYLDDDDKRKQLDPVARVAREWQDCKNSSIVGIEEIANDPVSHRSGRPRLLAVDRVKEWFERNYCRDICKLSSNPLPGVSKRSKKVYEQLRSLMQTYPCLEKVEECAVAHLLREPVSKVHACFLELFKTGLIQTNRTSKSCLPVPLDMWRQRRQLEQQKLNNGQHAVIQWSAVPEHQAEEQESVKLAKRHHSKEESGAQVAAREKAEEVGEDEDSAKIQITFQAKKATKKRRNEASREIEPAKRQRADEQQSRHKADTHDPLVSLSQLAKDVYAAASALVIEKQTDWLRWIAHATMGYPIQEAELVERLESSKDVIHQACSELCDAGLMKEKSSLKRWYYTIPKEELQSKSQSTALASWNEKRKAFEQLIAATIEKDYDSEAEEPTPVDAADQPLVNDEVEIDSALQAEDERNADDSSQANLPLTSLQRRRELDIWDPLLSVSETAKMVYEAAMVHLNAHKVRSEDTDLGPHITTRNLFVVVRQHYLLRRSEEYMLRFCTELCDLGLLKLLRKDCWVPIAVKTWRFQLQEDMDVAWSSVTRPSNSGRKGPTQSAADRARENTGEGLRSFDHRLDLKDPLANVGRPCRLLYWHMQDVLVENPYLEIFEENVLAAIYGRSTQSVHQDMLELRRYGLVTLFLSNEHRWLPVPLALWREQRSERFADLRYHMPYKGGVASQSERDDGEDQDIEEQVEEVQDEEIEDVQEEKALPWSDSESDEAVNEGAKAGEHDHSIKAPPWTDSESDEAVNEGAKAGEHGYSMNPLPCSDSEDLEGDVADEQDSDSQPDDLDPLDSVSRMARTVHASILRRRGRAKTSRNTSTLAHIADDLGRSATYIQAPMRELCDVGLVKHDPAYNHYSPITVEAWHKDRRDRQRTAVDRIEELLRERAARNLRLNRQVPGSQDPLIQVSFRARCVYASLLQSLDDDAMLWHVDEAAILPHQRTRRDLLHAACTELYAKELIVASPGVYRHWLPVPLNLWIRQRRRDGAY
ncbi:hypothetical protein LTR17_019376 [Elasticomyces elasticus]|nr:hypothetical protein LTR17_019376 [Elasticomyces elasticus]